MEENRVTVLIEVFNEEKRIEDCLKSFAWADKLIVFDKGSTDETIAIARKYATEIINVPFSPASENSISNFNKLNPTEWVFFITASSLIHPRLVDKLVSLTKDNSFPYDAIAVPYGLYCFGVRNNRSPWRSGHKKSLIRKDAIKITTELHKEINITSNRIYTVQISHQEEVLYHLTNFDAEDYFYRQIRYTKYEGEYNRNYNDKFFLLGAFFQILKSLAISLKRGSIFLGWDGVALSMAYTSYYMMRFVFIWDKRNGRGANVYRGIRSDISRLWDEKINHIK